MISALISRLILLITAPISIEIRSVQPGQTRFKNCSGQTQIGSREMRSYDDTITTDATAMFVFVSHTFFCYDICWLQVHGKPHPLFHMCICMQQLIFTACTEPHALIHSCWYVCKALTALGKT